MRLKYSKSKNSLSIYIIKDIRVNKKRTTKIVEKLGTYKQLKEKLNGKDPIEWAKEYVKKLNEKQKEKEKKIITKYSPVKQIPKGNQRTFNGGYLFLEKIYHDLKLNKICKKISKKYKFKYDLNSILSRLIYSRILYPSSKLSTYKASKKYIEQPNFEIQHIYRALEILAKESNYIESEVYKNSEKILKRNKEILYYDCTNYFFEIEQEEGIKQYGLSKEHRPNPIVQMGLFMDGDGLPLSFTIFPGNRNEQQSLKPIEKRIIKDFKLSQFIVCTDAGLSSAANRRFNSINNRGYIVTQSIKKLKGYLKEWALDNKGWYLPGKAEEIDIKEIDNTSTNRQVYYKERWIKENGLEQKLIITYSPKYKAYQEKIRQRQEQRAKTIMKTPSKINKKRTTDPKRLIKLTNCTETGEKAEYQIIELDIEKITEESKYDGYYGVCTNIELSGEKVIKINKRRWEIEEIFRILKK